MISPKTCRCYSKPRPNCVNPYFRYTMIETQKGIGKRVCIVGGGFTGLAAAYQLSKAGLPVTLFEKDEHLGGLAGSFQVGDQMLEKFYHHWFTSDQHIMELIRCLGVEDQVDFRDTRTGMYYAESFFKLSSPLDVLRFHPLSMAGRIRLGLAVIAARKVKDWKELEGITAEEWLLRLCGRQVYRVVWEPLLTGKFGDLASEISAVWFWNKLKLRGGSRGKSGREQLAYFRGGFSALAQAIASEAKRNGAEILTGLQVSGLEVRNQELIALHTSSGRFEASAAILTTPLPIAAGLLDPHVPGNYVARLRHVRHLSNVCIVLELNRSLSSTYWLNVNDTSFPFVAVIEHTNFQPTSSYGGRHIVYLSKYLLPDTEFYLMPDEGLFNIAASALRRMFPAFGPDWVRAYHIWRADYAQPVIERNYGRLVPDSHTPIENVFLATMAQVYPEDRGTNYAVRNGIEAASRVECLLRNDKAPVESSS